MLEEIKQLLLQLKQAIEDLPSQLKISTKQVVLNTLSDLCTTLGLIQAGEFRVGNGKEPGHGFTGVRIAYPPMTYGGSEYPFVSVNNDTLEVGISLTDGKFYAGRGFLVVDSNGLNIYGASGYQFINFYDADDPTDKVGYIVADRGVYDGNISLVAHASGTLDGTVGLFGQRHTDGAVSFFRVSGSYTRSDFRGYFQIIPFTDMTNGFRLTTSANSTFFSGDFSNRRIGIRTTTPQGTLHVVGDVLIGGDSSGYAGTIGLTNVTAAVTGANAGSVVMGTGRANAGWQKIMIGTTAAYVPYWTNIS